MKNLIFKRNKNIVIRLVEKEAILFVPKHNRILKLNQAATIIWRFLYQKRTFKELKSRLTTVYDADTKQIEKDLQTFLKEAQKLDLVIFN